MGKQATLPRFSERQAGATAKFLRIPPRKARLVIDAVRGKYASDALAILKFVPNFAARAIEDVIQSAMANAENGRPLSAETARPLPPLVVENLKVVRAFVDEGPRIKRLQPRAQGRAYRILKRMCHITVVLEESEPKPRPIRKPKARRAAAPAARPAAARPAAKKATPKPAEVAAPVEETTTVAPVEQAAPVEEPIAGAAATPEVAAAEEAIDKVADEVAAEPAAEEPAASKEKSE